MKFTAITKENVEGFRALLLPEVSSSIRRGEDIGALGLLDETKEIPVAIAAVAGVARNNVFQILSLMVEKKYRRMGCGRQLLEAIEDRAKEFGLPLTAEYPAATEDQELLEEFFLHLGFEEGDVENPMVRFPLSALHKKSGEKEEMAERSLSFAELPEEILRRAEERAKIEILPMPEGGFFTDQIRRDCSFGVEDGEELAAYVTFEELPEKEILLSSLWCRDPAAMAAPLLSLAFRKVKETRPGDTIIYAYIGSDCLGDFIGEHCSNPEIVSRKFVK